MGPKRTLNEMMRPKAKLKKKKEETTFFFFYVYMTLHEQFLISFLCAAHACDHRFLYAYGTHATMMMTTTLFLLLIAINLLMNILGNYSGEEDALALLGICRPRMDFPTFLFNISNYVHFGVKIEKPILKIHNYIHRPK